MQGGKVTAQQKVDAWEWMTFRGIDCFESCLHLTATVNPSLMICHTLQLYDAQLHDQQCNASGTRWTVIRRRLIIWNQTQPFAVWWGGGTPIPNFVQGICTSSFKFHCLLLHQKN